MLRAVLATIVCVPPFGVALWLIFRDVRRAIDSIDEVEL